jgi:hypothetical protein
MTDNQSLQNLLNSVAEINKKYEEMARISGENFNIFKVLNVHSREVRTHSAFLAELLNRNGTHGMGAVFLELFISYFKAKNSEGNSEFNTRISKFNPQTSEAKVEFHTGFINKEGTEGGRIDIIVIDKSNNEIIIENKIYAGDQNNQLLRYYNHNPNAPIFYLTLDGKKPSPESKGDLKENVEFISISYKKEILEWLEVCKKEALNHPILRETINQYIFLIKQLTNQTTNNKMSDEIVNYILNNGHIENAFEIDKNIKIIKLKIMDKFYDSMRNLAKQLSLDIEIRVNDKSTAIIFSKIEFNFDVQFYFENNFDDVYVGISTKEDKWVGSYHKPFIVWQNSSWNDVYNDKLLNDFKYEVENFFNEIGKFSL